MSDRTPIADAEHFRTECAICGWSTLCFDDGEAAICVDRDMCHILVELNQTRRELAESQARERTATDSYVRIQDNQRRLEAELSERESQLGTALAEITRLEAALAEIREAADLALRHLIRKRAPISIRDTLSAALR